jgi:hypothetical protein
MSGTWRILMKKIFVVLAALTVLGLFMTPVLAENTPLAVPSFWPADTATGIDPNPTIHINVTCENATVYFRSNHTGTWVTYHTVELDDGPYTTHMVNWTTTNFYGSNTTYYWSYNVQNHTTLNWVNATKSFTTRVVTVGETSMFLVSAFIPILMLMVLLSFLFAMVRKLKF